jgi:uncharacterized membrane protein
VAASTADDVLADASSRQAFGTGVDGCAVIGGKMEKNRLEAFSDGVIAIIITIMVLELKVPHGTQLADILPLMPVLLSYLLSFIYVAIYWNNHHHMLHAARKVNGCVLWANMHLLFWLSLIPFVTGWMGENSLESLPVAIYGIVLFMAGFAYFILARFLVKLHGADSTLGRAIGSDTKGKISLVCYALAVILAYLHAFIAIALYVAVAIVWFLPDRRIEHQADVVQD